MGGIRASIESENKSLRDAGPWLDRYSTGRDDLVADFYAPALGAAIRYDRATGYFRSSFYALTRVSIASFALRGGKVRLIASPDLDPRDVETLGAPEAVIDVSERALEQELRRILNHPHAATGAEILAALLLRGNLEIRLAIPHGEGIFHDKYGIFEDPNENRLSFAGSVNETWRAWHPLGNHESFEAFRSWGPEPQRTSDHSRQFGELWKGGAPGVHIVTPSSESLDILTDRLDRDPSEALRSMAARRNPGRRRQLMDHQFEAIKSWRNANRTGILKHATGSGKTITALNAIREHLESGNPSLVIVPSVLLLSQWDEEAAQELEDLNPAILLAGGGNDGWQGLLRVFTSRGDSARLTIATLATASSAAFLSGVNSGGHLLVVADEVHRLGAPGASKALSIVAGGRLGLSATPERAGDPDGTQKIFDYFGEILQPEFTLADAVAAGRLCRYRYEVHPVRLTEEEEREWETLTIQIRRVTARNSDDSGAGNLASLDPYLKALLIRRARVAKQAEGKPRVAASQLGLRYERGQRWLVYCDDVGQLKATRKELLDQGLESMPYYAEMPADRDATMRRFEDDGGILVAIKCLDEGVDIPSVSHAMILASSKNPREFIQRRGRVLRVSPGKRFAEVHDVLVDPPPTTADDPFRSLVLSEIARAAEFAQHSEDETSILDIERFAINHGIDPTTVFNRPDGIEED